MRTLLICSGFVLFFSFGAGAEPKATFSTVASPDRMRKFFPEKDYVFLGRDAEIEADDVDGYLQPRDRNALFEVLKFHKWIEGMDEFAKDMLVLDAQAQPLEKLEKIYPKIPKRELASLQKVLNAMRGEE